MNKLTAALGATAGGLFTQGPNFLGKGIAFGLEAVTLFGQLNDGLDSGKIDAIILGQRLNLAQ